MKLRTPKLLSALGFMIVALVCAAPPASATPELRWRVENPFRFFTDPRDTEVHRATFAALPPDERRTPVLSSERALQSRHEDGWAATMVQKTCWNPKTNTYTCAAYADYDGFAGRELAVREMFRYPPFQRLIHLLLDGPDEEQVRRRADELKDLLLSKITESRVPVRVLGPAPMPISRLAGQYRWHLTLKGRMVEQLRRFAALALDSKPGRGLSGVRVQADVDPVQMI